MLGLAYRTAPYAGRVPAAWTEVWDTSPAGFPGPRLFPANPVGLLEVALLADGVAPDLGLTRHPSISTAPSARSNACARDRRLVAEGNRAGLMRSCRAKPISSWPRPVGLRTAIAGGAIAALAPLPQPQAWRSRSPCRFVRQMGMLHRTS